MATRHLQVIIVLLTKNRRAPNMGTSAAPCTAMGSKNRIHRVLKTGTRAGKTRQRSAIQFKYRLNTTISETMQWFHNRRWVHGPTPMSLGRV